MNTVPDAKYKRGRSLIMANVLLMLIAMWAVRHIYSILFLAQGNNGTSGYGAQFGVIYAFAFGILAWQTLLYCLEKPYTVTPRQQNELNTVRVIVNVPVCNEDVSALKLCLVSLVRQSRRPDLIHVVVNGPNRIDYAAVREETQNIAKNGNVDLIWSEQTIAGKRQAQAATVRRFLKASDIFLSIDSDSCLDQEAIVEGLKPFAKPRIMSVAGVVLTINNRAKLLTRLSGLWFTTGQLVDRSSFSAFGAVLVNSGAIAFYRGSLMIDNLDGYVNETFFGRPVEFSDDSLLTIYALRAGRAVQQPSSFAFTLMPETMSHHLRQQVRWMRGAFIRSWWRFRYLSLRDYAFWGHLMGWWQLFLSSVVCTYLFVVLPITHHISLFPYMLYLIMIPILVAYGQALRFLAVTRSDESWGYRLCTFSMEIIPALWAYFVLRFVRYYSIVTCLKTGWGTRQNVEVGMAKAPTWAS